MANLAIWDEDHERAVDVDREQYCKVKAEAMVEFGYPDVTPEIIEEHVASIIAESERSNRNVDEGFDIVRRFVEGDLVLE